MTVEGLENMYTGVGHPIRLGTFPMHRELAAVLQCAKFGRMAMGTSILRGRVNPYRYLPIPHPQSSVAILAVNAVQELRISFNYLCL